MDSVGISAWGDPSCLVRELLLLHRRAMRAEVHSQRLLFFGQLISFFGLIDDVDRGTGEDDQTDRVATHQTTALALIVLQGFNRSILRSGPFVSAGAVKVLDK
jgi:hypothetical protein